MAGNPKQQQPSLPQTTPVAQQLAKLRSNGHQAPSSPTGQKPQKRRHITTISLLLITLALVSGILWQQRFAWYIAIIPLLLLLLIGLILIGYIPQWSSWTGFGEYSAPGHDYQRRKTLWDWLQLLGLLAVPLAVTIASAWFSAQQNHDLQIAAAQRQQDQTIAMAQRQQDQTIAKDQQEQTTLETYLDRMQELLINSNLSDPKAPPKIRALARARTLAALSSLNPERKKAIIQFLYEANLINRSRPIINLAEADLSGVDLSFTDLAGVDLAGADLTGADLTGADLTGAFLSRADLSVANLTGDHLYRANLTGALLFEADLTRANLTEADLDGSDLTEASLIEADLTGAYLEGANLSEVSFGDANLTEADLNHALIRGEGPAQAAASLQGTVMPDGSVHP